MPRMHTYACTHICTLEHGASVHWAFTNHKRNKYKKKHILNYSLARFFWGIQSKKVSHDPVKAIA